MAEQEFDGNAEELTECLGQRAERKADQEPGRVFRRITGGMAAGAEAGLPLAAGRLEAEGKTRAARWCTGLGLAGLGTGLLCLALLRRK